MMHIENQLKISHVITVIRRAITSKNGVQNVGSNYESRRVLVDCSWFALRVEKKSNPILNWVVSDEVEIEE